MNTAVEISEVKRTEKKHTLDRFNALEADKKKRILNAAFGEFQYGYKKASTDAIVKKAGISKGLLFHYFGSKENLYRFLVDYAMKLMHDEYFNVIQLGNRDILESVWQSMLLQEDITTVHPHMINFLKSLELYASDTPIENHAQHYQAKQKELMEDAYNNCDLSLFREDIDPRKAIDIIITSLDNMSSIYDTLPPEDWANITQEQYQDFLDNLQGYLDIFRTCFYR